MRFMSIALEELEKQARSLSTEEEATLARILMEEFDTDIDPNAEQLWLEEAQRRYDAFLRGELEARPGDEVMQRARESLRSRDKTTAKCQK
jgi:Putative addiction module component